MRVAVTGATGMIGSAVVRALRGRGDEVTVLSRSADRASSVVGGDVEAFSWQPTDEAAPAKALEGCDGVVHLAGEPIAQRWSDAGKRRILESREIGTRNLVAGLRNLPPPTARMRVLVSQSAAGWDGARGGERLDEAAAAGDGVA